MVTITNWALFILRTKYKRRTIVVWSIGSIIFYSQYFDTDLIRSCRGGILEAETLSTICHNEWPEN